MSVTKGDIDALRLAYDPRRSRFLCTIGRPEIEKCPEPPLHLYESALQALRQSHKIAAGKLFFYHERLREAWRGLKDSASSEVTLVLAQFCPDLAGARIDASPGGRDEILLTLPAGDLIGDWRATWLEAYINDELQRGRPETAVHAGQLRTAFARAAYYGEDIRGRPIALVPRTRAQEGRPYQILSAPERLEVHLRVDDLGSLATEAQRKRLHQEIDDVLWNLALATGASPVCRGMRKEIDAAIDEALAGPQQLGLELPLLLPAGFFLRDEAAHPRFADPAVLSELCCGTRPFAADGAADGKIRALLERRGLVQDGTPNPRVRTFPVVALEHAIPSTRHKHLELARRARETRDFDDREMQALAFPISTTAAKEFMAQVDAFWRETHAVCQLYCAETSATATMLAWSCWYPLTTPIDQTKRKSAVQGPQPYDGASWLSLIVRELIGLRTVGPTPEGIATALKPMVSAAAVEKALKSLVSRNLLTYDAVDRRYYQSAKNIMTGDDLPSERLRQVHEELSELAATNLEDGDPATRSRSMMIRLPADRFTDVKQRLRIWLADLLSKSAKDSQPEQVFMLTAQLFLFRD